MVHQKDTRSARASDHPGHETAEVVSRTRIFPATQAGEPQRIGEVMQGDHGFQAAVAQQIDHLAVPGQRILAEYARLWLDAAPFD